MLHRQTLDRTRRRAEGRAIRFAIRVTPVASIQTQETIDVCHSHKIILESLNMTL